MSAVLVAADPHERLAELQEDYDELEKAYTDAVLRIELLEEYALRMLQVTNGLRKLKL